MLTLLLSQDWIANRDHVLHMIAKDVADKKSGRILIVPELISHDTERRLSAAAGDTASRFVEVLTFTRLAKRVSDAAGFGAPECLDNGGRLVAMASATRQLHSKLKAYAAVETRPEFLSGLVDAVDEFKRCCIGPKDLYAASKKTEGAFAQKLEELSLIMEAYDSLCARGKRDPRDQMTWLLEQLEDSSFASEHVFYVDGFPDLTRQHTEIIAHLIESSQQVVVAFTCDDLNSNSPAFEKAASTALELVQLARRLGVETEIVHIQSRNRPINQVLPFLFQGKINACSSAVRTVSNNTVHEECHFAAQEVLELVQAGCHYRDIGVVCTDMATYGNTLNLVFSRYNIPVYLSGTEDILNKTVITTVLSAIDAAVGGYEQGDVVRYLRSALSPLDIETCDRLENYAILWNISGTRWATDWENHPGGLGVEWKESDRIYLASVNTARNTALSPLFRLGASMKDAVNLRQMIDALYIFLDEIQLDVRLQSLANQEIAAGDLRSGQILVQLWEILLSALEQLADTLGDTHWDAQTFTRLLKLLLSQYDVGTIPAVLDAVVAGSVSAMRCQQTKHLIVLGANEGSFPSYSGTAGIFTDQERTALRNLGVPLTGGGLEGLQAEFAEIYGVFCGAEESISVSCSGGQPSFLYRRLSEIAGGETSVELLGVIPTDSLDVSSLLVRNSMESVAQTLGVEENYKNLLQRNGHSLGRLLPQTLDKLYGAKLRLSASQVDRVADCRLSYFLKYGLKLKERKSATVDPAEFGTYVHAVLEETGRKIMELGGFHKVSLEKTLEIANTYSRAYISDHFSQIDSQRLNYLLNRNAQELEMVVVELWQELRESDFEPVEFELAFDTIPISGKTTSAELRGFVDRVDAWKQDGQVYYRVVDYKTGKKDFDYCDVFNGLGLQMLLYLFALEEQGSKLLGENPVPAGVQYFPARAPVVATDGKADETNATEAREKLWKRKGLLLADEAVLYAMEPSEQVRRLSYSRKKDGTISGDLADRHQMELLKGYVFALLGKIIDDISSGNIEPNPYTRGGRHNACAFCPYGAICHQQTVGGRRDYAAMSAQKFWEEIEKEMKEHG